MKKLQSYYVFKFNSSRLKNSHYKITLDINQARKNGELVTIGESKMVRSLFRLQGKEIDYDKIKELFLQKKKNYYLEMYRLGVKFCIWKFWMQHFQLMGWWALLPLRFRFR